MNEAEDSSFEAADAPAAVARAEAMLSSADNDTRWQGAILLGQFCETAPETIWPSVVRWGSSTDDDMRTAIATCVLEHVLEHHFDLFFDRSRAIIAAGNQAVADTLRQCWRFGQTELPANKTRLDELLKQIEPNVA